MTAHAHRAPFRPFDRERHRTAAPGTTAGAAGHAPEVLLALSAVLVVLAGPVARAVGPDSGLTAAASALLLVTGLVLAVVATRQLLRPARA